MGGEAEAERVRAERLKTELAAATRRLVEVEQARTESAGMIAALQGELEALYSDRSLLVSRVVAPFLGLERGLRWLGTKAGRLAGIVARRVVFRGRRR